MKMAYDLLKFQNIVEQKISETFYFFDMSLIVESFHINGLEDFCNFLNGLPSRDIFTLKIYTDFSEKNDYLRNQDVSEYLEKIRYIVENKEYDEKINIKLSISKNISEQTISLYSLDAFIKYINSLRMKELFNVFKETLKNNDFLIIISIFPISEFYTETLYFLNCNSNVQPTYNTGRKITLEKRNDSCAFLNAGEFSFIPEDFKLVNRSTSDLINNIFDKCMLLTTISFIANISKIDNVNNTMYCRINGHRLIEKDVDFGLAAINSNANEYYKIYEWIYSGGSTNDKIGIARNILTIGIKDGNPTNINYGIYSSIQSAHEVYLKQNIQEYIEIKNKVTEFLFDMCRKTSELANSMSKSLINNLFAIITFFVTIIIMNSFSDKRLSNIFTKDITVISLGLWGLSIIYMVASLIDARSERKRFNIQYDRLKRSYNEILNDEDIKNIFKSDAYYNEDIVYINTKIKRYTKIWCVVLGLLLIIIISLGYKSILIK